MSRKPPLLMRDMPLKGLISAYMVLLFLDATITAYACRFAQNAGIPGMFQEYGMAAQFLLKTGGWPFLFFALPYALALHMWVLLRVWPKRQTRTQQFIILGAYVLVVLFELAAVINGIVQLHAMLTLAA